MAGGGTGSSPKGSGIIKEYIEYSSSSTPSPVYSDITETQCITVDLPSTPDLLANILAQSNGSDYYLHYGVQDKALNSSNLVRVDFKIDNDDPILSNENYYNGLRKTTDDQIMIYANTTDNTSGTVRYIITETISGSVVGSTVVDTYISPAVSPTNHTIDLNYSLSSTSGVRTIKLEVFDQANNYTSNSFNLDVSTQEIIWTTLTAERSTSSPFIVTVQVSAYITPNSPDLLAKYYFTYDRLEKPNEPHAVSGYQSPIFQPIGGGVSVITWSQTFSLISNSSEPVLYAFIETSPNKFYSKNQTNIVNPTLPSGTPTILPPTGSIEILKPFKKTGTAENEYKLTANGGLVTFSGGGVYPNGDLIIAYLLTDNTSYVPTAPEYNSSTLQYDDVASQGWNFVVPPENSFLKASESFTFSGTFGTKKVRLWVATVGYSKPFDQTPQTFFFEETVEYINDNEGPEVLDTTVVGGELTIIEAGSPPEQTRKKPSVVSSSPISATIDLYDPNEVYRWVFSPTGFPIPNYQNLDYTQTTTWNQITPATNTTISTNFSFATNQVKTFYLYAMDTLGNISENKIKIEFVDPVLVPTPFGMGDVTKFEGKPVEHETRKTIASMFGNGVQHETFISLRTSENVTARNARNVQENRIHKLSEYRGLRVFDVSTNSNTAYLPEPSDPIKFSQFKNKKPRIVEQNLVSYTTDLTSENIPTRLGDTRNFSIIMDIDTGTNSTSHLPVVNQNMIDIDSTWTVEFIDAFNASGTDLLYPPDGNFTMSYGVLNGTFDKEGTYIIKGQSSFGDIFVGTYFIQNAISPDPPEVTPPIGPVPASGNFVVSHPVDQLSIGVDAVFIFDRSGSYTASTTPPFIEVAAQTFQTVLNKIDEFSEDSYANYNARYAVAHFGNLSELAVASNFGAVNDKSGAIAAVNGYANPITTLGGLEPQYAAVKRVADQSIGLTDWRTSCLKMILLYTDELVNNRADEFTWVDAVDEKGIYFVLFNGYDSILPDYQNPEPRYSHYELVAPSSGVPEITAAMDNVFNEYAQETKFELKPHIPGLFKVCEAATSSTPITGPHTVGTQMPIPYNDRVLNTVHFYVELDEDVVGSFFGPPSTIPSGTKINIVTYIVTYNSTNNPLKKQKLIIEYTF